VAQSLNVLGMSRMGERVVQHRVLQAPFMVSCGKGEKGLVATGKLEHRRTRHRNHDLTFSNG
jgi:hypothetical protein